MHHQAPQPATAKQGKYMTPVTTPLPHSMKSIQQSSLYARPYVQHHQQQYADPYCR